MDTHTAVGLKVYQSYRAETNDDTLTVLDATASPFKFTASVWEAIKGSVAAGLKEVGAEAGVDDEFTLLRALSKAVNLPVHPALRALEQKPVLHHRVCATGEIRKEIAAILSLPMP